MPRTIFIAATLAFAATLPITPAQAAGVDRTFVSAAGSDSNNCANVATPRRHFQTAYNATALGGEIVALDPANYGSLTIDRSVSIEGHGWASISPPSGGGGAITINSQAVVVVNIIGVILDGTGTQGGIGIQFISPNRGGSLTVRDSVIRNFLENGINFAPNTSDTSQIFVSNTLVLDNGSSGIDIRSTGLGTTSGVLNRVEMYNNNQNGLFVGGSLTQSMNVTVSDSVSANNAYGGIECLGSGNVTLANVMVRNSTIANNVSVGLQANGTMATISVTRSTITGNGAGWGTNGGTVLSYGDNNIDGNAGVNSEPPNPLVYK
jgi:hypothetical protein